MSFCGEKSSIIAVPSRIREYEPANKSVFVLKEKSNRFYLELVSDLGEI